MHARFGGSEISCTPRNLSHLPDDYPDMAPVFASVAVAAPGRAADGSGVIAAHSTAPVVAAALRPTTSAAPTPLGAGLRSGSPVEPAGRRTV
jgi:hypothetical protein